MSDSGSTAQDPVRDLYASCYRRLVGVVALAAGSQAEAEECVQEAFIRLLRKWSTVSRYEDPEGWTRMVAFRLLSHRRRKARNGMLALFRHGEPAPAAGPTGDQIDIARALAQLPLGQRQVVVLYHLVDLDVAGVAAALGVSAGTVKSPLSRARQALAPLLREEAPHVRR